MATPELFVLGCSHRTAPLEVRETLVFAPEQVLEALRIVRSDKVLRETVILSTCNRTEFYSLATDAALVEPYLRDLIARFKGSDVLASGPYGYTYRDRDMVRHLLRVASGLDSMVLGEVQILGQVKDAYTVASESGSTGVFLNRLLAAALRTGKRARTETEIGEGAVSFASAAVGVTRRIFSDLTDKRILLVGAGEAGRIAAEHFAQELPAGLLIANRTMERGMPLAVRLGGKVVSFDEIPAALIQADVVVCATRAPGAVIGEDMVRRAMRERSSRPLVFVDMAVPRDVDAAVARLDNVFVYSLDALQTIVDQSLARRRREVKSVEGIVEQELERFFEWSRSLEVTPIVREMRDKFESFRKDEIRRHLQMYPGADPESLEALSRALMNKFLHHPTTRIKSIDLESEDGPVRLDAVRELFDLSAGAGARRETRGEPGAEGDIPGKEENADEEPRTRPRSATERPGFPPRPTEEKG